MQIAIVGAGLAGLAAAQRLAAAGIDANVYEAKPHWGGHAHSDEVDGFWFDEGPHVSFTGDAVIREMFERSSGGSGELTASIGCYFHGHWTTHPVQVHLHGLPADLVADCILDFFAPRPAPTEASNYAEWLVATYGRTFAETFPYVYTRKYWTVEPAQLSTDWIGPRMQRPSAREMVLGALTPDMAGTFHYLKTYRYPRAGAFRSYVRELGESANVIVDKEVSIVDVATRKLHFADGSCQPYDQLISTMPLDQLLRRIGGVPVPVPVRQATDDLLCTSVVLVDIGIKRAEVTSYDWLYFYDEDICISRLSAPSRYAASMAPAGCSSVQAEVYFSRERPLRQDPARTADRVVGELIRVGILRDQSEVLFSRVRVIPYANVVVNQRHASALSVIRPFVAECGITLAGRYGEWKYYWTDDAIHSGWRAAAGVTERITAPAVPDGP
ncbi:O-antigen synthesis protein WbyH [Actinocatenispora thailandica]|uniref:O-antigen synthesis protein WbyH n=1 Tax=Actinocatenispora thailandica TaxID=227318 RepID=A0A7R7DLC7_9ACTN|nr:FAD-dependent oxidoreductase [Actinocatenispora thailandica]BCJ33864.1 O-antigen synthesis protein WbyH [Actinocatenispora thailandica]